MPFETRGRKKRKRRKRREEGQTEREEAEGKKVKTYVSNRTKAWQVREGEGTRDHDDQGYHVDQVAPRVHLSNVSKKVRTYLDIFDTLFSRERERNGRKRGRERGKKECYLDFLTKEMLD